MAPARTRPVRVAELPLDCSRAQFLRTYARTRAVLLRRPDGASADQSDGPPPYLRALHAAHPGLLDQTFCREDGQGSSAAIRPGSKRARSTDASPATADALLASTCGTPTAGSAQWYASFIVQRERAAVDACLASVPCAEPPCLSGRGVRHGGAIWWFIGRNPPQPAARARGARHAARAADGAAALPGRPEHTDAVSHDGTWHYQLEGKKAWSLRPTDELCRGQPTETVVCAPGDILVLSTREWWHSTSLPPQPGMSISYARDFTLGGRGGADDDADAEGGAGGVAGGEAGAEVMSNVDGLFAREARRAGGVVLTEADLPDCELPEADDPNCEVAEDEATGMMCLVATRDIAGGEFLSVARDDDDADDDDDDGSADSDD